VCCTSFAGFNAHVHVTYTPPKCCTFAVAYPPPFPPNQKLSARRTAAQKGAVWRGFSGEAQDRPRAPIGLQARLCRRNSPKLRTLSTQYRTRKWLNWRRKVSNTPLLFERSECARERTGNQRRRRAGGQVNRSAPTPISVWSRSKGPVSQLIGGPKNMGRSLVDRGQKLLLRCACGAACRRATHQL
jgi:hypothetical protein